MLKVELLSYHREGHQVFSGMNFDIAAGTCLFVTGQNGSGKTTLLRLLAGFLPVQEGKITINGTKIFKNHDFVAQNIEYVGHQNATKKQLTAWDNLKFWNNICEAHDRVDLEKKFNDTMLINDIKNKPISLCSSGEKRRVALSRLHMSNKKLWLLDEPTSSLDKEASYNFGMLVKNHCLRDGIAIITTHNALKIPDISSTSIEMKKISNTQSETNADPFLSGDW
tara:strand:- start:1401 stop:2072 length:672 start_codon:yes stop_codon:yes gene_type:complete